MRGPELAFMNLYEFVAIIIIIPIPNEKKNIDKKIINQNKTNIEEEPIPQQENTIKNIGRFNNKIYYFPEKYPVSKVKVMSIRSKFLIPKFVSAPPPFPDNVNNSQKSKNKQNKWALFILTHFKPWDIDSHIPCQNPNWESFCNFLQSLVLPNTPRTNKSNILIILNIAHGLKVSNLRKLLLQSWRARATQTWEELKLIKESLKLAFPKIIFDEIENNDNNDDDDDNDDEHIDGIKYNHEDIRAKSTNNQEKLYAKVLMAQERNSNNKNDTLNYIEGAKFNYSDLLENCVDNYKNSYHDINNYNNNMSQINQINVKEYVKNVDFFSKNNEDGSSRINRILDILKMDELMTENENILDMERNEIDLEQTYLPQLPLYDNIKSSTVINEPFNEIMLNNNQKILFQKLYNLAINNLENYIDETKPLGKQELEVILGGPGSGKSFLIQTLLSRLDNELNTRKNTELQELDTLNQTDYNHELLKKWNRINNLIAICATTGAAAANIKHQCRTVHNYFCINISNDMKNLTSVNLQNIRNRMYGINIIIIDEISMLSTENLGKISKRLQEIKDKHDEPFGGCSVYLIGDFSQLPAVRSESLHHGLINAYDNVNVKNNFYFTGRNLFKKFHVNFLQGYKRSENDANLSDDIRRISDVNNLYPINKQMLNYLQEINHMEMTLQEKFQIAPIAVTSNVERFSLLMPSLLYHSYKTGTRIIYWRKEFLDKYDTILNEDYLYSSNFEELHGFFVKDVNCIKGCNQSTSRGIANVYYHLQNNHLPNDLYI